MDVIGNPTLESGVNFIIYPKVEGEKITVTLVKDKATDGLESTAVAGDLFTIKFKGKETGTARQNRRAVPVPVYPCRDSNAGNRLRRPMLYPTELQGHAAVT